MLNNGDTITERAIISPVINDSTPLNNSSLINQFVRGSYDPNDKTEMHGGKLTHAQYATHEDLQYLIRFQNTGTDTAFFVTVKDTFETSLDLKTLEMISSSHPYSFRLEGNVGTWDFKMIKLADSATDKANSHGYIMFK